MTPLMVAQHWLRIAPDDDSRARYQEVVSYLEVYQGCALAANDESPSSPRRCAPVASIAPPSSLPQRVSKALSEDRTSQSPADKETPNHNHRSPDVGYTRQTTARGHMNKEENPSGFDRPRGYPYGFILKSEDLKSLPPAPKKGEKGNWKRLVVRQKAFAELRRVVAEREGFHGSQRTQGSIAE